MVFSANIVIWQNIKILYYPTLKHYNSFCVFINKLVILHLTIANNLIIFATEMRKAFFVALVVQWIE